MMQQLILINSLFQGAWRQGRYFTFNWSIRVEWRSGREYAAGAIYQLTATVVGLVREVRLALLSAVRPGSTSTVTLEAGAGAGIFSDSGCWDTLLLVTFDRWVRLVTFSLGGWLLSHGLAERAGTKVIRELQAWAGVLPTHTLGTFTAILRTLAAVIGVGIGVVFCLGLGGGVAW